MEKKNFLQIAIIAMFALVCSTFVSCGDDDDGGSINSDIVGTWNDNMDDRRISISFTFKADGSGEGSFDSPTAVHRYVFKWSYSGNTVTCKGKRAYASTDGSSSYDDWSTTFKYRGSILEGGPRDGWTYKKAY